MKSFLLAIFSLTALAAANPRSEGVYLQYLGHGRVQCRSSCHTRRIQDIKRINDCAVVNCPPAVRDGLCSTPDCSLEGNILRLHPHPDPNYFYQCRRTDDFGGVEALVRPCACGTVFSASVDETRCVHPWEWKPDCPRHPQRWQDIILSQDQCREDCETCGDGGNTPPPVGTPPATPPQTTQPPVGTPPITPQPPVTPPGTPPGDGCNCCMPCIWWPCMPCQPSCNCNNSNNNRQQPNERPVQIPDFEERPRRPSPPRNDWRQPDHKDSWDQPRNDWQNPIHIPVQPDQPRNEWQNRPQWFSVDEQKEEEVKEQLEAEKEAQQPEEKVE